MYQDNANYPSTAAASLNAFAQIATADLRAATGNNLDTFESLLLTYRSDGGNPATPTLTARVDAVLDEVVEPPVDTVLAIIIDGEADLVESVVMRGTEMNIPVISLARYV